MIIRKAYLLVFSLLALVGCKKELSSAPTQSTPVTTSTGLPGTWELASATNGNTGRLTTYPAGNGQLFVFTTNTYQTFTSGSLVKSGTYTLAQQFSIVQKQMVNTIIFDRDTSLINIIYLNGNQLSLSIDGYDTPSVSYTRIK
ncbi:hypothetical protein [uncultured Mucilaginibacter sp.]|uniref:hypothetical protein n=1 Tax=uncultured Mucilaginibacter sp. TaxID=797541 RepID=UPI0026012E44|nr:hypothetical protein [uncultured Mucilaginibacter sp.]